MQLWVKVVPRSKKFSIAFSDSGAQIRATEEPENGKVNLEIIKQLEKKLGRRVRILRGGASRKKLLDIEGEENEVLDAIARMNEDYEKKKNK